MKRLNIIDPVIGDPNEFYFTYNGNESKLTKANMQQAKRYYQKQQLSASFSNPQVDTLHKVQSSSQNTRLINKSAMNRMRYSQIIRSSAAPNETAQVDKALNSQDITFSIDKLKSQDIEQIRSMQGELSKIRMHHKKINQAFLEQIEQRNIIFVEDGTDLKSMNIGQSEGMNETSNQGPIQEIMWKKQPKHAIININKYMAKYNFEIARKLSGQYFVDNVNITKQAMFEKAALQELLEECSSILTKGEKIFKTLYHINGTPVTCLADIPEDCKLLVLSTKHHQIASSDGAKSSSRFKGLKGNIYVNGYDVNGVTIEQKRIRRNLSRSKDKWFMQNLQHWNEFTPGIQNKHRAQDIVLHFSSQSPDRAPNLSISSTVRESLAKLKPIPIASSSTSQLIMYPNKLGNSSMTRYTGGNHQDWEDGAQSSQNNKYISQLKNKPYYDPSQIKDHLDSADVTNIDTFFKYKETDQYKLQRRKTSCNEINRQYKSTANVSQLNMYDVGQQGHYNKREEDYFLTEANANNQYYHDSPETIKNKRILQNSQIIKSNNAFDQQKIISQIDEHNQELTTPNTNKKFYSPQRGHGFKMRSNSKSKLSGILQSTRPQQQSSILTYKEVEKWAEKYKLKWKEVYDLDAKFQAMVQIEKEDLEQLMIQQQRDRFKPEASNLTKDSIIKIESKIGDTEPGITLKTFMEYTKLFKAKDKSIKYSIISAFGIDATNKNSKITWDLFLQMKCFMHYFTLCQEELVKLWVKVLDPSGIRHINLDILIEFLELLARGSINYKKTLISETYAHDIIKLFDQYGCINGQDVLMEKVEECLKKQLIDVEVLNQVLKAECMYIVNLRQQR